MAPVRTLAAGSSSPSRIRPRQADPALAAARNRLLRRGADVGTGPRCWRSTSTASDAERAAAFAAMDGLLLTGGADVDPAGYGAARRRRDGVEPDRDELEAEAWAAAMASVLAGARALPRAPGDERVRGRALVQHVDGHAGPAWAAARR